MYRRSSNRDGQVEGPAVGADRCRGHLEHGGERAERGLAGQVQRGLLHQRGYPPSYLGLSRAGRQHHSQLLVVSSQFVRSCREVLGRPPFDLGSGPHVHDDEVLRRSGAGQKTSGLLSVFFCHLEIELSPRSWLSAGYKCR